MFIPVCRYLPRRWPLWGGVGDVLHRKWKRVLFNYLAWTFYAILQREINYNPSEEKKKGVPQADRCKITNSARFRQTKDNVSGRTTKKEINENETPSSSRNVDENLNKKLSNSLSQTLAFLFCWLTLTVGWYPQQSNMHTGHSRIFIFPDWTNHAMLCFDSRLVRWSITSLMMKFRHLRSNFWHHVPHGG